MIRIQTLFSVLTSLLGLTFILSAVAKLFPIQVFELALIDLGIVGWQVAPYFARIIISAEFFLGTMLLFQILLNRKIIIITIGMLIVFTIHLIYVLVFLGNSQNCMCFGNILTLTPFQSIIKNIGMLILLIILYYKHKGHYWNHVGIVSSVFVVLAFVISFVVVPVDFSVSASVKGSDKINKELDFDKIYSSGVELPKDIRVGKHLVMFGTLQCSHCKIAAYRLALLQRENPNVSCVMMLLGNESELAGFFSETKSEAVPYVLLNKSVFIELAGVRLPVVYFIHNSVIEHQIDYKKLHNQMLIDWYGEN